jgi:ABC-type branched-subunit amino acid transport system ATPase component
MALAAHPRLLLLDEPVTGMNLDESGRVMDLVKTIRAAARPSCSSSTT